MLLKPSSVRNVSFAEGLFWFFSAARQQNTEHLQHGCHQVCYWYQSQVEGEGRNYKRMTR